MLSCLPRTMRPMLFTKSAITATAPNHWTCPGSHVDHLPLTLPQYQIVQVRELVVRGLPSLFPPLLAIHLLLHLLQVRTMEGQVIQSLMNILDDPLEQTTSISIKVHLPLPHQMIPPYQLTIILQKLWATLGLNFRKQTRSRKSLTNPCLQKDSKSQRVHRNETCPARHQPPQHYHLLPLQS